jgi:CheY-like chemotaxis protein
MASEAAENTGIKATVIDPAKEVILVLEDSLPNLNILKLILEKLNFAVLAGVNGNEGVQALERCAKEKLKLVAIISDLMMPEMDGLKFLEHVKASNIAKDLPFVFVTASSEKSNVLEAKRLGVIGYLLKPVTMDKIKVKLKEIFPGRKFPVAKG